MKFLRLLPIMILLLGVISCIEDTIQVENISKDVAIERQISIPLVKTEVTFENIAGSYDSLIIDVGDTIYLYLNQDLGFQDTMKMTDMGENIEFEFLNLHYKVTNMFPVGLDVKIFMYDSILDANLDTIWFSEVPGELFINPAPVDGNGLAIVDQVETTNSYVGLDQENFDNLFNGTTHLLVDATIPSTGGFIKVLKYHRLYMNLGIEARGRYITSLDSLFNDF